MCTHYDSMKYDVCVHIMIVWNMMYVYTYDSMKYDVCVHIMIVWNMTYVYTLW